MYIGIYYIILHYITHTHTLSLSLSLSHTHTHTPASLLETAPPASVSARSLPPVPVLPK